MIRNKPKFQSLKLLLFLLSFWGIGLLLALFFGLGWFFLFESLRRLLTYIPPINHRVRNYFIEKGDGKKTYEITENPSLKKVSNIIGLMITIIWLALTVFVFFYVNIRLIDIF